MSPPPYMRMYWGNYFRQTKHLNRSQHGAYLMLLSSLWSNGGKLPADDATLSQHALCTPKEWAEMKAVIMPFFDVRRGKLSNRKVSEELAHYEAIVGKRKSAGKAGSEVTNSKRSRSGAAFAEHLPPYPEPEPESRLEAPKRASKSTRRERPEARHEGASDLRVIEGGVSEREAWDGALRKALVDLPHFEASDPDFASEIAEFVDVALARLGELEAAA